MAEDNIIPGNFSPKPCVRVMAPITNTHIYQEAVYLLAGMAERDQRFTLDLTQANPGNLGVDRKMLRAASSLLASMAKFFIPPRDIMYDAVNEQFSGLLKKDDCYAMVGALGALSYIMAGAWKPIQDATMKDCYQQRLLRDDARLWQFADAMGAGAMETEKMLGHVASAINGTLGAEPCLCIATVGPLGIDIKMDDATLLMLSAAFGLVPPPLRPTRMPRPEDTTPRAR